MPKGQNQKSVAEMMKNVKSLTGVPLLDLILKSGNLDNVDLDGFECRINEAMCRMGKIIEQYDPKTTLRKVVEDLIKQRGRQKGGVNTLQLFDGARDDTDTAPSRGTKAKTSVVGNISKLEAVQQVLKTLGKNASIRDIQDQLRKRFSITLDPNVIAAFERNIPELAMSPKKQK